LSFYPLNRRVGKIIPSPFEDVQKGGTGDSIKLSLKAASL